MVQQYVGISVLKGKTITSVDGMEKDSEEVVFTCSDGSVYKMYHIQDCCESVLLEDVCGDVEDLIGGLVLHAEERCSDEDPDDCVYKHGDDSFTWTFYDIQTTKGSVNLRWLGESNGWYGESVDVVQIA